jgi:hypothetical protein
LRVLPDDGEWFLVSVNQLNLKDFSRRRNHDQTSDGSDAAQYQVLV